MEVIAGAQPIRANRIVFNQAMLSLQEISDRLEIQQLLIDYSTAIDQRRFDDLDRVFTGDAYIDYRAMGGIDGRYPQVKAWLAEVLPSFPSYAHMLGNFDLHIDGDTASSRTICFNPMVLGGDKKQVLFCGIWYEDDFLRTPRRLAHDPTRRSEVLRPDRVTVGPPAGHEWIFTVVVRSGTMVGCLRGDYAPPHGHTHARQNRIRATARHR